MPFQRAARPLKGSWLEHAGITMEFHPTESASRRVSGADSALGQCWASSTAASTGPALDAGLASTGPYYDTGQRPPALGGTQGLNLEPHFNFRNFRGNPEVLCRCLCQAGSRRIVSLGELQVVNFDESVSEFRHESEDRKPSIRKDS